MHGDRRVVLDQPVRLEPVHPAQHGVRASAGPDRVGDLQDEPGDTIGVAGALGVVDRVLRRPVGLEPCRRAHVELAGSARFLPAQLRQQQLAQQVVVAVPLAAPVERHDEEVAALQLFQQRARSRRVERGIAQRATHPLEHGGTRQERRLAFRQPIEQLGPEVVDHEAVVTAERPVGRGAWRTAAGSECREVQTGRPALGAGLQRMHVRRGELDTHRVDEGDGLGLGHREVVDSDLDDPALGAQARRRQWQLVARADGELRARRQPEGEGEDGVEALPVRHGFEVVDDEGDRLAHRRQRGDEAPGHLEPGARGGEGTEQRRRETFDPVQRGGDVGQQDDGVVVVIVGGDPAGSWRLALGPLHERRRLAVPGWGDHGQHGRPGCAEHRGEQLGAGDDPRAGEGHLELGLGEPERDRGLRRWLGFRLPHPRYRGGPFAHRPTVTLFVRNVRQVRPDRVVRSVGRRRRRGW